MLLTQELRGGTCHFELHLDSEREKTPFAAVPQLSVLLGKEGHKPAAERVPLRWTTADVLSADVPLRGEQTLLASLELPGIGRATLPPVCLPYSPEFAPRPEREGLRTLERLARTTGGIERINLADTWRRPAQAAALRKPRPLADDGGHAAVIGRSPPAATQDSSRTSGAW